MLLLGKNGILIKMIIGFRWEEAFMKLMVLDGNSIVNRAFYGVHMLTTRENQTPCAVPST